MSVAFADVLTARARITPYIRRTALLRADGVAPAAGAAVALKLENTQVTGSFKPRGIVNAVLSLPRDRLERGVITMSAGNTAIALAYAAHVARAKATVVMPQGAPRSKVDAVRELGGEIVFHPDRVTLGERLSAERERTGATLVHPHEDPEVLAGHGTLALEILEDEPTVSLVVVAVGGGGLIAGIAAALAERAPRVRVVGVETRGAPTMRSALQNGAPKRLDRIDTIADGLTAPIAGRAAFEIVRQCVADVVLVDDGAVREAMRVLAREAKQVVEPAGATALAGLLSGAVQVRERERVVVLVSGGNVDLDRYGELLRE